jgi:hypothetical protein
MYGSDGLALRDSMLLPPTAAGAGLGPASSLLGGSGILVPSGSASASAVAAATTTAPAGPGLGPRSSGGGSSPSDSGIVNVSMSDALEHTV